MVSRNMAVSRCVSRWSVRSVAEPTHVVDDGVGRGVDELIRHPTVGEEYDAVE